MMSEQTESNSRQANQSERQARSRKARAEAGGKQVSIMLSPEGYGALAKLLASSYAPTKQKCVEQALITAAKYA